VAGQVLLRQLPLIKRALAIGVELMQRPFTARFGVPSHSMALFLVADHFDGIRTYSRHADGTIRFGGRQQ
jgi:hypothetical protein